MIHELHEELALEIEQPLLVGQRAGLDVAAAHHIGDAAGDEEVMLADEAAIAHVHELRLDRRHAGASGHRESKRLERRAIAGRVQREGLADRRPQQLMAVEHDRVGRAQIAHLFRFERGLRHVRHRRVEEPVLQEREHVGHASRLRRLRSTQCALFQAAGARDQADPDFDQPDVAFERGNRLRRMQDQFAAAAEGHAADGRHHRNLRVLQPHVRVLHLLLFGADRLCAARHEDRHHRLQVRPGREGIIRRPDHQPAILRLREFDRFQQARDDARADCVHLRLHRQHQHFSPEAGRERPEAHGIVLEHRLAAGGTRRRALAQQRRAEDLACVDGKVQARDELLLRRRP